MYIGVWCTVWRLMNYVHCVVTQVHCNTMCHVWQCNIVNTVCCVVSCNRVKEAPRLFNPSDLETLRPKEWIFVAKSRGRACPSRPAVLPRRTAPPAIIKESRRRGRGSTSLTVIEVLFVPVSTTVLLPQPSLDTLTIKVNIDTQSLTYPHSPLYTVISIHIRLSQE